MKALHRSALLVLAAGIVAVALTACGSASKKSASTVKSTKSASTVKAVNIANTSGGKPCSYKFAVITHGDNGSFWSVVYKGAKDASADLGCNLTEVYGSQQQGQAQPDDNAENDQIQNAINAGVQGIAVSDHDPTLLNPTLAKAAAKGIPVVLLNAGCDPADIAAAHALTCVGQPEVTAGQAAAAQFTKLGATNALCIIHQSGQNLLDRCNGLAQGLGVGSQCKTGSAPAKGPGCTELILSTPNAASNPQQATGQVTSYLQSHPGINSVLTLNPAIGDALVAAHIPSNPKIATFAFDPTTISDIRNGSMAFTLGQQQYLQGYLPIQFLFLYLKHHGNTAGVGSTVDTGPQVVDKANINQLAAAVDAGED